MRVRVGVALVAAALVACGGSSDDGGGASAASTTAAGGAGGATTGTGGSGGANTGGSGGATTGTGGSATTGTGGAGGATTGTGGAGGDPCAGQTLERHLVTPDELHAMMATKDFELVNVHIPYEGEILGTDANIAYTDVPAIEDWLGHDRGAKAVLYCFGGSMSETAGDQLVALGYCRIYDLVGGLVAWKKAGYPTK
jgi:rhodanese-related sulfurtransferase